MKHIYQFFLYSSLLCVSACAYMGPHIGGHGNQSVELPQKSTYSQYELPHNMMAGNTMNMASIMSNENVIVYPVDGNIDVQRMEFPEYRGTMENTTASGYTVFDPSVTVYAVEGDVVQRPSYLPEYSVPKYAQPRMQNIAIKGNGSLMPAPLTQSYGDGIIAEPLPRAPRLTRAGTLSNPTDRAPSMQMNGQSKQAATTTGRRSSPMLTGY